MSELKPLLTGSWVGSAAAHQLGVAIAQLCRQGSSTFVGSELAPKTDKGKMSRIIRNEHIIRKRRKILSIPISSRTVQWLDLPF